MKKTVSFFFTLSALSLLLSSCALLESLKDPDEFAQKLVDTIAPLTKASEPIENQEEYYIGREVAAIILSNYKLYRNQKKENYLNLICMTLAINSDVPEIYNGYHVAILDTDEINALSTSGGHILVTRGLLDCADSEEALAGMLAHELAHIQLKHGIKAIQANRITGAAIESTGNAAWGKDTAEDRKFLEDVSKEIATKLVNSGYSKTQEYDADKFAVELMAKAGYDPNGMCEMLQIMQQHQQNDKRGFGKTHPSAKSRIKKVEKKATKLSGNYHREVRVKRYNEAMH